MFINELKSEATRRRYSRFFCITLSVADHGHGLISLCFHLHWDLAAAIRCSTCSHALHVLQQSIFAGRVAADDGLEGLVALDVVGDALEERLVADGGGIVGFVVGFGVDGLVCAVGQVDARVEVHCHCFSGVI